MKICNKCEIERDDSEFRIASKERNTLRARCKKCESDQKKEYYKNNVDEIKKQHREYRKTKEAKDKRRENRKKYTEKENEESRLYYKNNKEIMKKQMKKYYLLNSKRLKQEASDYKKTKKGKMSSAASDNKRRILKESLSDGTVTAYSLEVLMKIQKNKCYYCGDELKNNHLTHLDHYIPLSKKGSHSIYNVVWSCSGCNLEKSNTIPSTPLRKEHLNHLDVELN